jgi:Flp pilus assembly protein TadG
MAILRNRGFAGSNSGATAVEFAVIGPVLLTLLVGSLYVCVLLYSGVNLQTAVEQAARCYSLQMTQCKTTTQVATYAAGLYSGANSPTFIASSPTCGHQVSATVSVSFIGEIAGFNVPLTAQACYP